MKFTMENHRAVPNGTIFVLGVSYAGLGPREGDDANRGVAQPKIFTYVLLKAGGLWYTTGSGQVPVAAGWIAVERWLGKSGRTVEWVKVVIETAQIWPVVEEPETVEAFWGGR